MCEKTRNLSAFLFLIVKIHAMHRMQPSGFSLVGPFSGFDQQRIGFDGRRSTRIGQEARRLLRGIVLLFQLPEINDSGRVDGGHLGLHKGKTTQEQRDGCKFLFHSWKNELIGKIAIPVVRLSNPATQSMLQDQRSVLSGWRLRTP